MQKKPSHTTIAAGLFLAVFLWGGNNTGVKYLVKFWPPIFTGCTRFLAAGALLCALLRWTKWFGETQPVARELSRRLWLRGGLSLAAYILAFNWALKLTSVAHVTLYLGAAPVWALIWEGRPERSWKSAQRLGSGGAGLFPGGAVLLWPTLRHGHGQPRRAKVLGLCCSVLWTLFGRQCRVLGRDLTGPQVSTQTFWRCRRHPGSVFAGGTLGPCRAHVSTPCSDSSFFAWWPAAWWHSPFGTARCASGRQERIIYLTT